MHYTGPFDLAFLADDEKVSKWDDDRIVIESERGETFVSLGDWLLRNQVQKAWLEIRDDGRGYRAGGAELVVMLVPANRTEQGWWQRHVEPHRDRGSALRVEFLPGRPRFIAHNATEIRPNERPPFGCCLLIWGER